MRSMPGADQGDGDYVLIVEDDAALRRIMREVLEDEGLLVQTASDGRLAVRLARERLPALVVLDMALPGLNGTGVAAGLREDHTIAPPILLVSSDESARQRAHEMGAFAFLSKPLELEEFVSVVHRGLGTH